MRYQILGNKVQHKKSFYQRIKLIFVYFFSLKEIEIFNKSLLTVKYFFAMNVGKPITEWLPFLLFFV